MEDKMVKQFKMIGVMLGFLTFFLGQALGAAPLTKPSGQLVNGFRVLSVAESDGSPEWTVFRGDYIKFNLGPGMKDPVFSIPSLSIEKSLVSDLAKAPYFKMKEVGSFDFLLGSLVGILKVVEYNQINYEAVSAQQGQQVIDSFNPIILDVRTPREYARGHLENSVLIPVRQLQSRMDELAKFSDEPILIYCATGNRSTVASKLLIDKGFTRIFNLRHGIKDWARNKYPIVK
jgi:rhodanese-related sulfurtransferase